MARFFQKAKDGGKDSCVDGYFLIELKPAFSIVLLNFHHGSREAFHTHAFNAISWYLKGHSLMEEDFKFPRFERRYRPSWKPIYTPREKMHKVRSIGSSWVLSFRGPWIDTWREWTEKLGHTTLTNGRVRVA